MAGKEFKVVLAGAFGSGKSTFASQLVAAKKDKTKIASMKAEVYPVKLYTSAGPVTFELYDTTLHAKGGLPDQDFFRTADAAVCFYDISKQASYDALEDWYDAVQSHNSRKGSAPLPVVIVGTKVDLLKDRAVKSKDIDFARKRSLPYLEISSKANYHVKDLLLGIAKALLGAGTQLTDEIEMAESSATVDEEAAEACRKEYADAK